MAHSTPEMTVSLLSGAVSGGIARFCVAPLDIVKIRFQIQVSPHASTNNRPRYYYNSILNAFSTIYKEEGVKGLWRGNLLAEMMWMVFGGVQFGSFHLSKTALTKWAKMPENSATSLISGGVAGCLATVTVYPLDLLRTRFAAQSVPPIHPTIKSAVETIYRTQGWTGFYHGVCPSLWQLVPYMAIQFFVYDSLKDRVATVVGTGMSSSVSGALAGLVAKLTVLPMDVVKKRLQVHGLHFQRHLHMGRTSCPGILPTMRNIHTNEGVAAFFKGSIPAVLKASLQSALVFTLYEETRKILSKHL